MPLNTTDIEINIENGWLAIPCTGTVVHIVKVARANIMCRIGIGSNSTGFILKEGDTIKSEETVYVRPELYGVGKFAFITVVKD